MLNWISTLQLSESGFLNLLLQTLIFEVIMFLSVPVIGLIVDGVIVRGLRKLVQKIIGAKGEFYFSNYVLCIGVVIHELSHALFALISGAKIEEIALFKPEGDSLGHVNFTPRGKAPLRALQMSFSACAPVVMGIVICSFIIRKAFPVLVAVWQWIIMIYLFISVLFHMNMSTQDLKCYFRGTLPLLITALPICLIIMLFA